MGESDLEDSATHPFDPEEWIGKGRKLPSPNDIPQGLAEYFHSLKEIPTEIINQHFPKTHFDIETFLVYEPPKGTFGLVNSSPIDSFRLEEPHTTQETTFAGRTLPPLKFVEALNDHFRQGVLDNMHSIVDPAYPDLRLPLWIIRYWMKMWDIRDKQDRWRKALTWLGDKMHETAVEEEQEIYREARRLTKALRWSDETNISGAIRNPIDIFTHYLSDNTMMNSYHINMMFAHLSDRIEKDETIDSLVAVETLRLWGEIDKAKSAKFFEKTPVSAFLRRLEKRILDEEIDFLVFPVRVDSQTHWLTFKLDFKNCELAYGDSLAHELSPPSEVIKKLKWWLKGRFKKTYKDKGDSLEHGHQNDWTDCGILTANTAAREIFEDELWSKETKQYERGKWFVTLVSKHMKEMNEDPNRQSYVLPVIPVTCPRGNPPLSITALLNPLEENEIKSTPDSSIGADLDLPIPVLSQGNSSPLLEQSNLQVASALEHDIEPDFNSPTSLSPPKPVHPFFMASSHPHSTSVPQLVSNQGVEVAVGSKKRQRSDEVKQAGRNRKTSKLAPTDDVSARRRGLSKSSIWARLQREKYQNGDFADKTTRMNNFRQKILQIDPQAYIQDSSNVRHFLCGETRKMKYPFNIQYFQKHVSTCKGSRKSGLKGGGMNRLDNYFSQGSTRITGNSVPCPGLEALKHLEVAAYLDRTGSAGGGASSVTKIALELYGKGYARLSNPRKIQVKSTQSHEWTWRNDHNNDRVFSTSCSKLGSNSTSDGSYLPCFSCHSLLLSKKFKNACRVPKPADENYKYINTIYQNKKLAALYGRCAGLREIIEAKDVSPLLKYVQGILSHKYEGDNLFISMIQALAIKHDKEERGVGMQNMRYAPDLIEFSHILFTHSPRAYDKLREVMTLPDPRTLRIQRARQPRFPVGIQPRTFELVEDILRKLQYTGPVALSCDDTKLLASFRPFYDEDRKGFFVMGHTGDPYELVDHQAFQHVVESQELTKATKLRLFCLQVPIPKIPTIIVAALSIPDNLDANELLKFTWEILMGLLARKIKVASYATDGSNVERSVQDKLEQRADRTIDFKIKHPADNGSVHSDIVIPIFVFGDQPIAILQDPKHLLKTCRNNSFSGAQVPVLPNHPVLFSDILEMGRADSPIYLRDVEKVDRQDDNAATRLFSGATLEWLSKEHPMKRGLICFLFMCGEMIDAYQSRSISIEARVQMILRAHFFFEFWEKFIEIGGYSKKKHFLSPQCVKIIKALTRGFLQLVVIYRDYENGRPLLPWLLGTEAVEHMFGMCRQIVKDFTMLDFHLMIPKLFIKLREAFFSARSSDGKARASGYSHTHTDTRGINLLALSTYPTDLEIQEATNRAYEEAHSILAYLGLTAENLYCSRPSLPSISSWWADNNVLDEDTSDDDRDLDAVDSDSEKTDDYQTMLDKLEDVDLSTNRADNKLMDYRYATVALSIEDQNSICNLPELDDEAITEAYSDDAAHIRSVLSDIATPHASTGEQLANALPPLNIDQPETNIFMSTTSTIDVSQLVHLRFLHQTKQAETGVRKVGSGESTANRKTEKPLSERQQIIRKFAEILKQQDDRGVGTGLERSARWILKGSAKSISKQGEAVEKTSGNSANAAAVADATASSALTKRKRIFKNAGLPEALWDGRINALNLLRAADSQLGPTRMRGGYGFAVSSNTNLGIILCKVLTIYSKGGGNRGKHGYVESVKHITAASNIVIQVFQYNFGTHFHDKPLMNHAFPQLLCFDIIPSILFLCDLQKPPILPRNGQGLQVSQEDADLFKVLRKRQEVIVNAVKTFNSRKKSTQNVSLAADEEVDDEEA